jgi:hypothetical protein
MELFSDSHAFSVTVLKSNVLDSNTIDIRATEVAPQTDVNNN